MLLARHLSLCIIIIIILLAMSNQNMFFYFFSFHGDISHFTIVTALNQLITHGLFCWEKLLTINRCWKKHMDLGSGGPLTGDWWWTQPVRWQHSAPGSHRWMGWLITTSVMFVWLRLTLCRDNHCVLVFNAFNCRALTSDQCDHASCYQSPPQLIPQNNISNHWPGVIF